MLSLIFTKLFSYIHRVKLFRIIILGFLLSFSFSFLAQTNLDSLYNVWKDTSNDEGKWLESVDALIFRNAQISSNDSIKIDSLKSIINTTHSDLIRIRSLVEWDKIIYKFDTKLDSILLNKIMSNCSTALEKNINDSIANLIKKNLAYSLQNFGTTLDDTEIIKKISFFEKSIDLKLEIKDTLELGVYYGRLGLAYSSIGNYDKALENQFKSIEIRKKSKRTYELNYNYNNVASIYSDQGFYNKALKFYEKSLEIKYQFKDTLNYSTSFINIGYTYRRLKNYDKALDYLNKALESVIYSYNPDEIEYSAFYGMGDVYFEQINFKKALDFFEKSVDVGEKFNMTQSIARSRMRIGEIYFKANNYELALKNFKIAKEIAVEFNSDISLNSYVYKRFYELHKRNGNFKEALINYELYKVLADSLNSMNGIAFEKNRELNQKYLLKKQTDSIKHLDEILIQQAQTLAKEEQLKNETQRRNGLIVISLLILVSLGLVFNQLKKVRKGKALVEEKQQEITDSINYAKRLQQGILVPFDLVQSWLSESFILFKPKDIVSGDFYWIEKVGNKMYFAVADCTGHGIPGALVSIICSNALTKSLYEDFTYEPSRILDNTRAIVEERFVRSKDEIKDGMDISLCCLNVEDKSITWAGAMNPLWVVRKGSKEVEELKPDRQSIGMVEKPKRYKQHEVKLAKGDSVYLFSDGYQDQFGGEKGRKYMKGRFKKFILSVQDQDMQTQLTSFEKEFNSWKGDREQIDDVCVMGVRIS